jgi:hypothetical protein
LFRQIRVDRVPVQTPVRRARDLASGGPRVLRPEHLLPALRTRLGSDQRVFHTATCVPVTNSLHCAATSPRAARRLTVRHTVTTPEFNEYVNIE